MSRHGGKLERAARGTAARDAQAISPSGSQSPPRVVISGVEPEIGGGGPAAPAVEALGTYPELARQLGERTASLHLALAQDRILYTGRDFVILDFEGEPARPIAERRLKRSPLVDVAGMLRSFDYASWYWLVKAGSEGLVRVEDVPRLEPFARLWSRTVSRLFLDAYRAAVAPAGLLPDVQPDLVRLLEALTLEKCLYELSYELGHRPDWVGVPLRGAIDLLDAEGEAS